jgi:hypothetical protein
MGRRRKKSTEAERKKEQKEQNQLKVHAVIAQCVAEGLTWSKKSESNKKPLKNTSAREYFKITVNGAKCSEPSFKDKVKKTKSDPAFKPNQQGGKRDNAGRLRVSPGGLTALDGAETSENTSKERKNLKRSRARALEENDSVHGNHHFQDYTGTSFLHCIIFDLLTLERTFTR